MQRGFRAAAIGLGGLFAVAAVGCGGQDNTTPAACLEGPGAYLVALADAPKEVQLDSEVRISHCLPENQEGGDLATVGEAMVEAATDLNADARANPGGAANLRLGYLLGAAERGAESTDGIHAELIRRLAAAARYSPAAEPLSPEFRRTYRQGFKAGFARG